MICIRQMTAADVAFGMRLKADAGWNQTEQDWRRFLTLWPDGCFVAQGQEQLLGTVITGTFDSVGWIGMMLVSSKFRGRGIGTALMRHALESLDRSGVTSVRLDATPMGLPLYQKMGFETQFQIIRYGGESAFSSPGGSARRPDRSQLDDIIRLDRTGIGVDRSVLLRRLFDERPDDGRIVEGDGGIQGYLLARGGTHAVQIGPCVARVEEAGRALLHDALCRYAGQSVFVDVAKAHPAAVSAVESAGLRPLRVLTRMCRGDENREQSEWLWASSGPELG